MAKRECILTGVELRSLGSKGLGLVANSPLALGTVVIQERPYATSLLPQSGPVTCRTCFGNINAGTKGLQSCQRCGSAYYCSYKCASLDRRPHRDSGECWLYEHTAGLSLAAPVGLHREAVLALRHLVAATVAESSSAGLTAATAHSAAVLQIPLSCHESLLAAGSPLERELAGWQAAVVATGVLRPHHEGHEREGSGRIVTKGEAEADLQSLSLGELAEVTLEKAAALAKAAGLGPGLGLLGAMLARAAAAGRAAAAAHKRAVQRRALRKQQREQRRQERQPQQDQEQQLAARQQVETADGNRRGGGGLEIISHPTTSDIGIEAAGPTPAPASRPAAPATSTSSESSYESSSSSDDGCSTVAQPRDRRRYPQSLPSVKETLQSVLQLQSVLCTCPYHVDVSMLGSADGVILGGSNLVSERQDLSGADITTVALAMRIAARAVAIVLSNALEVALHPPFAAGLIGIGKAAAGGPTDIGSLGVPLAMFRRSCRLNHSCRPTAAYHFRPGGQLFVRLTADLEPGAEVTVSYVDLSLPRNRRRGQLHDKYGFNCDCERCSDNAAITALAKWCNDRNRVMASDHLTAPTAPTALTADHLLSAHGSLLVVTANGATIRSSDQEDEQRPLSPGESKPLDGKEEMESGNVARANGTVGGALRASSALEYRSHCRTTDMGMEDADAAAPTADAAMKTRTADAEAAEEEAGEEAEARDLSLEQRLKLLVRGCGDLLMQGGSVAAEPAYVTLVHGLDKLQAEMHTQIAVKADLDKSYAQITMNAAPDLQSPAATTTSSGADPGAPSADGGGSGGVVGVSSGHSVYYPQHAACLDAYALLASAARRCARAAAAYSGAGLATRAPPSSRLAQAAVTRVFAGGSRATAMASGTCQSGKDSSRGGKEEGCMPEVQTELVVVCWWARAVCASLAGAAAAERLLAADPALLQSAAASWSDAASTACEMLSALFDTATDCRPPSSSVAAAAAAAAAGGASGPGGSGPCALLHGAWNPGNTRLPSQPAEKPHPETAAMVGTVPSESSAERGIQSALPNGHSGSGQGGGGTVSWSRGAMAAAVRAALASELQALKERHPPQPPRLRQVSGAPEASKRAVYHPEEHGQDHNHHHHSKCYNGSFADPTASAQGSRSAHVREHGDVRVRSESDQAQGNGSLLQSSPLGKQPHLESRRGGGSEARTERAVDRREQIGGSERRWHENQLYEKGRRSSSRDRCVGDYRRRRDDRERSRGEVEADQLERGCEWRAARGGGSSGPENGALADPGDRHLRSTHRCGDQDRNARRHGWDPDSDQDRARGGDYIDYPRREEDDRGWIREGQRDRGETARDAYNYVEAEHSRGRGRARGTESVQHEKREMKTYERRRGGAESTDARERDSDYGGGRIRDRDPKERHRQLQPEGRRDDGDRSHRQLCGHEQQICELRGRQHSRDGGYDEERRRRSRLRSRSPSPPHSHRPQPRRPAHEREMHAAHDAQRGSLCGLSTEEKTWKRAEEGRRRSAERAGDAKRRRLEDTEILLLPGLPPAAATAAVAMDCGGSGAHNECGPEDVGSCDSLPVGISRGQLSRITERAVSQGVRWRRYTAPEGTAAACGVLFRVCLRLGGRDLGGSVQQHGGLLQPMAAGVAAAAMDDWLAMKQLPSGLATSVAGLISKAGNLAVTARGSCGSVGVTKAKEHMDDDNEVVTVAAVEAAARAAAVAAAHSLARVHLLLQLLLGEAHGACEAAQFLPFFVQHLPYEVAAELTQLVSTLLSLEHLPYVPM